MRKLALIVTALLAWQALVTATGLPDYILPGPWQVAICLAEDMRQIASQLLHTLGEWAIGLVISVALAVAVATACFRWRRVQEYVDPILVVTQTIPFLAIAPLLMIWLGLGMAPKIVLIVLSCAFPVALALGEGLDQGRKQYRIVVSMMDLSWRRGFCHVYFPSALPNFFTGFKITASYAFITTVMAELIGSERGLGIYLVRAQTSYRTDRVIGAILVVIAVSLLNTAAVDLLRRRVVFWDQTKK